jgi:hypothetical protein
MEAVLDFKRGCQDLAIILLGVWGRGGFSSRQLILITWPQAVRQMRGVGRGGSWREGERGDMKQITAHSNPYSSFSLSFCPLCILQGFDENFARGRAEQK